MGKENTLLALLNGLVRLLNEEADRNPRFAEELDALLSATPSKMRRRRKRAPKLHPPDLPDVHAEFSSRGETEFRLWLRDQPTEVLRGLIRVHDLDAARRTTKWKDQDKLSAFITDQIRSRLGRGSGFLLSEPPRGGPE